MASLTVRQLDERLKKQLRLRAARSGRSVEDEVRTILREAAEVTGSEALDAIEPTLSFAKAATRLERPAVSVGTKRVLVVIGGGVPAPNTPRPIPPPV